MSSTTRGAPEPSSTPDAAPLLAAGDAAFRAAVKNGADAVVVPGKIQGDSVVPRAKPRAIRLTALEPLRKFCEQAEMRYVVTSAKRAAPAGRAAVAKARARRPRERRPARRQRAHVARSTSSADPDPGDSDEPGEAGRLCACGCGRDISHKRGGARTFSARCRKRLERLKAAALGVPAPAGAERLLQDLIASGLAEDALPVAVVLVVGLDRYPVGSKPVDEPISRGLDIEMRTNGDYVPCCRALPHIWRGEGSRKLVIA